MTMTLHEYLTKRWAALSPESKRIIRISDPCLGATLLLWEAQYWRERAQAARPEFTITMVPVGGTAKSPDGFIVRDCSNED